MTTASERVARMVVPPVDPQPMDMNAPLVIDKKPKKEEAPVVRLNSELVRKWVEAKRAAADATAEAGRLAAQMETMIEDERQTMSFERKSLVYSLNMDGGAIYSVKNQFSKIDANRADELAATFNGHYGMYFNQVMSYSVDAKAQAEHRNDPEVVAAFIMLRRLGILVQSSVLVPTETLFRDWTFDPQVRALCEARGIRPQTQLALPKAGAQ